MADYRNIKDLADLADAYGYDMKLHGKSLYWSSPKECPDTTRDLEECPLFKNLSQAEKEALIGHGHTMKRFGMGCYQERGANADLYDKYYLTDGPLNPFRKPKVEEKGTEPGMN